MEVEKVSLSPDFTSIDIPSKWDIIPIHNSDRASFKRCREYWNWTSPTRTNLMLRADVLGINIPMWFGTGIHWALQASTYAGPNNIKRSAVEAWKTWFDIQWRGGVVTAEWLDLVYDLEPHPFEPLQEPEKSGLVDGVALWQVRGLEDILPDPDSTQFDELFEIGIEMMKFYEVYAEKNDDFNIIMAEHDFSVPIWDYENDCILKVTDTREESPNYGKLLEVHARGRIDAVYLRPNGKLGLIDYKTTAKMDDEETMRVKLETDEQSTTYLWAGGVEASYYDLPHKGEPLEEVTFNFLRKAFPQQPTELKNGTFSVDRQNESTTYEILSEWISKHMPGIPLNEKQQGYLDYLREVGDEQFIVRRASRRNKFQLAEAGHRIYLEALDMLDPVVRIYPNLRNDYSCLNCVMRAPCLAKRDGSDFQQLIADNYVASRDR